MRTTVIAQIKRHGFHSWPEAPVEVGYLANVHRHLFTFKVGVLVSDSNREVEFHILQRYISSILDSGFKEAHKGKGLDFGDNSCEHLASYLFENLTRMRFHVDFVEVWEDDENGSRVSA